MIKLSEYMYNCPENRRIDVLEDIEINGQLYYILNSKNYNLYYLISGTTVIRQFEPQVLHTPYLYDIYDCIGIPTYRSRTISAGSIIKLDSSYYILAIVDGNIGVLISLIDGNRWNSGAKVNRKNYITLDEMKKILNTGLDIAYYVGPAYSIVQING